MLFQRSLMLDPVLPSACSQQSPGFQERASGTLPTMEHTAGDRCLMEEVTAKTCGSKLRSLPSWSVEIRDPSERNQLTCAGGFLYLAVDMKSHVPLGEFEQLVLLAILRLEDGAYGVSIRAELERCAKRRTTPGALYTTLDRMERKGLVSARNGEPTPERGGRAKRFYRATKGGKASLVGAQAAFHRMLTGLDLLGDAHG